MCVAYISDLKWWADARTHVSFTSSARNLCSLYFSSDLIIQSCLFVYSMIFQDVLFRPPPKKKKYFVVTFLATVGIESVVCEDPFITDSPWNCVFWRSWWRLYQPVNGFQILQDLLGKTKRRQKCVQDTFMHNTQFFRAQVKSENLFLLIITCFFLITFV